MNEPLLIDTKDAAKLLSVSERQIHYLREKEGLPCVKLGRSTRFCVEQIKAWIKSKAQRMQGWAL